MSQHRSESSVPGTRRGAYWLGDPASQDPAVVGAAVACLARLAGREYVPAAFCLTAPPLEVAPDGSLGAGTDLIAGLYGRLAEVTGQSDPAVVVRSALVGSGPAASWVPAPWTFVNVAGMEALSEAVTECAAPYASDRARAYRAARAAAVEVALAIVVQRFVPADVCCRVSTGADGQAVTIRSRWGLCDLTGTGDWDTTVVRRADLALVERTIADKRRMTVPGGGGVVQVSVAPGRRLVPCLDDGQAGRLAGLAAEISAGAGGPVEAEVAWRDDRMHLLWCEPGHAAPAASRS